MEVYVIYEKPQVPVGTVEKRGLMVYQRRSFEIGLKFSGGVPSARKPVIAVDYPITSRWSFYIGGKGVSPIVRDVFINDMLIPHIEVDDLYQKIQTRPERLRLWGKATDEFLEAIEYRVGPEEGGLPPGSYGHAIKWQDIFMMGKVVRYHWTECRVFYSCPYPESHKRWAILDGKRYEF